MKGLETCRQAARHYAYALSLRLDLISEVQRARDVGFSLPRSVNRRIWQSPSSIESKVRLIRFLDPTAKILLVDIGANTGYWTAEFLTMFPSTTVLAFEPVHATYESLKARFSTDPRVLAHNVGLSSSKRTGTIQLGGPSTMASLHKYVDVQHSTTDGSYEAVQLDALDSFDLAGHIGPEAKVILKLDVQGHEVDCLIGAESVLSSVDVAIAECSFVNEYVDIPPSFATVVARFERAGMYPALFLDYGRQDGPYAVQRDVIFVRKELLNRIKCG